MDADDAGIIDQKLIEELSYIKQPLLNEMIKENDKQSIQDTKSDRLTFTVANLNELLGAVTEESGIPLVYAPSLFERAIKKSAHLQCLR